MSLVGNLEDLSLGDLLQIVSLSQKSGVLAIESNQGTGCIVFHGGLVHAAGIKDRTPDLRGHLLATGELDAARIDALQTGVGRGERLDLGRVAEQAGLDVERLEAAIRASAESAIFEMFGWAGGGFNFDARADAEGETPYPCLRAGINAQFLAMEGMRLRDEATRGRPPSGPQEGPSSAVAASTGMEEAEEFFFGSEPLEVDAEDDLELESIGLEVLATHPARQAPEPVSPAPAADAVGVVVERAVAGAELGADVDESDGGRTQPLPVAAPALVSRPVVLIEPEAAALEWVRALLEGRFARIHVFQRAEQGLARIRQYLIRGEVPFVVISLAAPIDPLSGIHGLGDFVKRLRVQAPKIAIVALREATEGESEAVPASFDGVLPRPPRARLASTPAGDTQPWRERFEVQLARLLDGSSASGRNRSDESSSGAPRSAHGTAVATPSGGRPAASDEESAFAQARTPAEALALALDAAARSFARVAVLALRGTHAVVVAARGIETLAGERAAGAPSLACPIAEASLLRRIVDEKCALRASPQGPADHVLIELFGPIEPKTAYFAPIVVADRVAAVLYADQGAQRRPLPDTTGLERLLARASARLAELASARPPSPGASDPA